VSCSIPLCSAVHQQFDVLHFLVDSNIKYSCLDDDPQVLVPPVGPRRPGDGEFNIFELKVCGQMRFPREISISASCYWGNEWAQVA
jgi:hypothetical protein